MGVSHAAGITEATVDFEVFDTSSQRESETNNLITNPQDIENCVLG